MENADIIMIASIIIISIAGTHFLGVIYNKNKGKAKTNDAVGAGVKQMQDLYTQMITDLKAENKSLKGAVNKYRGLYDQDEEEAEAPEMSILQNPLLQAAAQKYGIDPALLNTPEAQKFIKKNKDMIPIVLSILAKRDNTNQPAFGSQGFGGMQTV